MKKILFFILIINQALSAQKGQLNRESISISNPANTAISPRLTTDNQGNPVLSWSEQDDSSDVIAVCFATSRDGGKTFTDKKNVRIVEGITAHAEGMPKIAFKSDGTIVAIYEIKRPTPQSRFAGDILYTISYDKGETWATPQYLSKDTVAGKSRSFADITRLPNGEIGVSWLGESDAKDGRPLKFSQTTKGNGFTTEIIVKEKVCQCCRTNLFVDTEGVLHIFFRDILSDGTRDMGHVVSKNAGEIFGDYKLVYPDKWKINACPHTGPSSAQLGATVFTAWYTGDEKNLGIKLTDNAGKILTHIKSANARHPQLAASKEKLILCWDEPNDDKKNYVSNIKMRLLKQDNKMIATQTITNDTENASYPTVLSLGKNIIIAYEAETGNNKKQIRYQITGSFGNL